MTGVLVDDDQRPAPPRPPRPPPATRTPASSGPPAPSPPAPPSPGPRPAAPPSGRRRLRWPPRSPGPRPPRGPAARRPPARPRRSRRARAATGGRPCSERWTRRSRRCWPGGWAAPANPAASPPLPCRCWSPSHPPRHPTGRHDSERCRRAAGAPWRAAAPPRDGREMRMPAARPVHRAAGIPDRRAGALWVAVAAARRGGRRPATGGAGDVDLLGGGGGGLGVVGLGQHDLEGVLPGGHVDLAAGGVEDLVVAGLVDIEVQVHVAGLGLADLGALHVEADLDGAGDLGVGGGSCERDRGVAAVAAALGTAAAAVVAAGAAGDDQGDGCREYREQGSGAWHGRSPRVESRRVGGSAVMSPTPTQPR